MSPFRVEVTGPGLEIKRNVPEEDAFRIAAMVAAAPNVMSEEDLEEFQRARITGAIRSLFREDAPGNNPARIAMLVRTAGIYLKRPIRRDELLEFFALSGLPVPSNFSRDLGNAVDRGLLEAVDAEDGEGEAYVLDAGRRWVSERHSGKHGAGA